MSYDYVYSYRCLVSGVVVEDGLVSTDPFTPEELFLEQFRFLVEKVYPSSVAGGSVEYEGDDECFPQSISELRGDSAINFEKMEFKLIDSYETSGNPFKSHEVDIETFKKLIQPKKISRGFGRSKKS